MPQYLSPGVYVEEVDSGSRPIEGVGTAVAAFVGLATQGPFNTPTLISNWTQFRPRSRLPRPAPTRRTPSRIR
jgi:phage tail sheath protein FI